MSNCDHCCDRACSPRPAVNVSTLKYIDKRNMLLQKAPVPHTRTCSKYSNFQMIVTEAIRKLQVETSSGFVNHRELHCYLKRKLPRFVGDLHSQIKVELLSGVKAGFIRKDRTARYRVVPFGARVAKADSCTRDHVLNDVDITFNTESCNNVCARAPRKCARR